MKVFAASLVYCFGDVDSLVDQLENDHRTQVYDEDVFCLERDIEGIQKKYPDLEFNLANNTLVGFLDGDSVLDSYEDFEEQINYIEDNHLLFYNSFEKWLDKLQDLYDEIRIEYLDNYKEKEEIYFGLLTYLAEQKYGKAIS